MSAIAAGVLFLLAALLPLLMTLPLAVSSARAAGPRAGSPLGYPRSAPLARGLGVLGVLALLPSAGASGAWPFVLLAAGAAALGTPLALACAAAGATVVALSPEASAPLAAAVAGLGAAAAADALGSSVRERRTAGGDPAVAVLAAGGLLALSLLLVDHQAVLSWSFGVGLADTRVALPGAGVALGMALVAAAAGVLLLGAGLSAPSPGARRGGLAILGLAVVAVVGGVGLAVAQAMPLDHAVRAAAAPTIGLLILGAAILAVFLLEARRPEAAAEPASESRVALATTVAAALALTAALVAGVESWWRDGAYATALTASAAAAALLGLAALEPEERLQGTRLALLLAALLGLLFA